MSCINRHTGKNVQLVACKKYSCFYRYIYYILSLFLICLSLLLVILTPYFSPRLFSGLSALFFYFSLLIGLPAQQIGYTVLVHLLVCKMWRCVASQLLSLSSTISLPNSSDLDTKPFRYRTVARLNVEWLNVERLDVKNIRRRKLPGVNYDPTSQMTQQ